MGKRPVVKPDWLTRTLQQRFDEKWMPEPNSGCWLWTGAVNYKGYGRLSHKLKPVNAQRISWFLRHGVMPPRRIDVCHQCDTPQCVNPDHLFLGTRKDNMQDMVSKGRRIYPIGQGKDWSKIRKTKNPLKRTHCVHGHLLSGTNLYISLSGEAFCKECRRLCARRKRGLIDGMAITATRP